MRSRGGWTSSRQGAQEKINFADHYVFTTWGCGTECLRGAAIDVKTGKVFLLPFTLCCWEDGSGPAEFYSDSRLFMGQGEGGKGMPTSWYYQIDDKKGWVLVREVPRPSSGQS